ncbi:AraC family transcriptional regulator [Marinobacter sp. 1_MG-2023]|uniref:AraC family transcriptional regulator n=1 Tax=Marinobacter sp. 1_MG-2023 TaxID=3062627 RepID=UPI0026E41013|nr:AraC family transcriptional regulator [Marinobacter sp. 1_MG-2023]MDO6824546.1 AraC family transcriptional regulator [Marinobacter sp. 1_MG-2023]
MFGPQKTQECRGRKNRGLAFICSGLTTLSLVFSHGEAFAASIDEEIAELKSAVTAHADEVFKFEQGVLHPVDTRLAVFLTLASRDVLDLDSVELFVNGKPAASHLYTGKENASLQQGSIQQLFIGNLANGEHELKAVITARAANDRFVRRETSHRFQKRPGVLRLQMALEAKAPEFEPRVSVVEWK